MIETKVLIIDDEKENVQYLTTILKENGFWDIHAAFDGEEGMVKIKELIPGLILLDLRMPKKNGIYVFNELKKSPVYQSIPVIILTGEGGFLKHLSRLKEFHEDESKLDNEPTQKILGRFISSSPDAFLEKPIEPDDLMKSIRNILITLEEIKEKRFSEINSIRDKKINMGVLFTGNLFDSQEKSRNILAAYAAKLAVQEAKLPDDFTWRSIDNQNISMTKEDVLRFHSQMTDWIYLNYKASWDHKAAIDKLTEIEAVENYLITQGWPDNDIDITYQ